MSLKRLDFLYFMENHNYQTINITNDATQDLQSLITASGFKETLLEVKNPDTKKFINELLGR